MPEVARSSDRLAQLGPLEPGHFWFRARNRLLAWTLRRHFPDARRLLEIGTGTGFVLSMLEREFPDIELHGSELRGEDLELAASRLSRSKLFQMDARKIPFQGEFDVLGAFDVLEHIEDDERVLREMAKALKPGGGVLLTVPQHKFLWSRVDDYSDHHRRYSAAELKGKLEAAGLQVVFATSFVCLLLPLFLLSRLRYRKNFSRKDAAQTSELKVGPAANFLLEKVLGLELWLIARGARLPFGSTLLVVARPA